MSRPVAILSYYDVSTLRNGRSLRVNALIDSAGADAVVFQPRVPHPRARSVAYPIDLGRRKVGINWGIFNLHLPFNRGLVRRELRALNPRAVVMTSIWDLPPADGLSGVPLLFDSQNVDAVYMEQSYGRDHWFTRLVERAERRVTARADHIFVCSENDRAIYAERYGIPEAKMTLAPNGVDTARMGVDGSGTAIDPAIQVRLDGKVVLFFMGKLDYAPNTEALRFLSGTLMPELERRQPGRFVLLVTGSPVPAGPMHPSMVFAGLVPELPPYLSRAHLCLAPLFVGSGTRLKILDYLAAGKPVIATPVAIEGIHARPGVDAVVDGAETFADHIVRWADRPEEARKLGLSGRDFVRANFDWASIRPKWSAVLERF